MIFFFLIGLLFLKLGMFSALFFFSLALPFIADQAEQRADSGYQLRDWSIPGANVEKHKPDVKF